jgi:dTDP-glucose pyrophosphorylase
MKNSIISNTSSILHALEMLEKGVDNNYTLFVVEGGSGRLRGTLTDGDIRRHLINNGLVSDVVELAMNRHFKAIHEGEPTFIAHLHQLKDIGIRVIPILDKDDNIVSVIDLVHYKSHLPIDAVLMAGGKGERLRPLTEKIPKPLVPIGNKAIIDYNIERLISYGVKSIYVTVNYLKEQLEEHFSQPKQGLKIECVREPRYLGTMGGIQFVKEFNNDIILVMNSDLFTNIDYEDFYLHFIEHNADMSVAAVPYSISIPYGIFDLDGRDIKGISEKPIYNYYANAGIYLIRKSVLKYISKDKFFNATDFIDVLIENNLKVIRFPITGYWIDIGQHADLKKAEELVKHLK